MDCIGEALPLHCHIHQDQKVNAWVAQDFLKCSEGGCQKKCEARLPCGHVCMPSTLSPLWYNYKASKYKCLQGCRKQLACGHVCKRKCYECSDGCRSCKEKVTKVLICDHSQSCACSDDLAKIACKKVWKEFYYNYVVISVKKNALDLTLLNVL